MVIRWMSSSLPAPVPTISTRSMPMPRRCWASRTWRRLARLRASRTATVTAAASRTGRSQGTTPRLPMGRTTRWARLAQHQPGIGGEAGAAPARHGCVEPGFQPTQHRDRVRVGGAIERPVLLDSVAQAFKEAVHPGGWAEALRVADRELGDL